MTETHEEIAPVDDPRLKLVDRAMKRLQYQPDALIEVLHTAQEAYGYLSFDAIKSFVSDKNPMALLEYRKKNTQALELYNGAADKLKKVMTAAGISQ